MVRNVDDLDFRVPSHAQDMLDGLQRLRSQPKLADLTLLVGGRELPCHRALLALSSPYFHAMFAGNFAESFSARVELRDVEPAVVGQLVDFVYTGRLTVTQGNVEALTRAAARLHFPAVQKVCGRYLQHQLDATNCLGICEFGEQQGLPGVAAKARAFLRENFEAVAREDEFLQLPRDRLATCLAGELLQVQPDQSRLEALLRWARHDPQARAVHLPELLSLVRLDAVPRPRVQHLLATEPLIRGSEECRVALSQGHDEASKGQGGEPRRPRLGGDAGDRRPEPRNSACLGLITWERTTVRCPVPLCAPPPAPGREGKGNPGLVIFHNPGRHLRLATSLERGLRQHGEGQSWAKAWEGWPVREGSPEEAAS